MNVVEFLMRNENTKISQEIEMYLSKYGSKNLDLPIDTFINKVDNKILKLEWEKYNANINGLL